MTTKLEQAARQALEALHNVGNALMCLTATRNLRPMYVEMRDDAVNGANAAITALREALDHFRDATKKVVEQAEQEPFDMNDHPPHRLCECRKCMEYFTPLPDCNAFAASGKPIAEQEPVAWMHTFAGDVQINNLPAECYGDHWTRTPLYAALNAINQALSTIRAARAQEQAEQEPVATGSEWKPCMKLPVVVHVREQREGESHVSTREGITPVRPDDLIMRGVAGEEYPIGRELFNKTYTFDTAAPVQQAEQEPVAWMNTINGFICKEKTRGYHAPLYAAPVRTKDLTDDDLRVCFKATNTSEPLAEGWLGLERFARAVIDADREKNK